MKAVVTGGAGFIGSHVVDLLVNNNYTVIIIDNLANGRLENIEHHKNNAQVSFVNADIGDYNIDLQKYFDGVDYVFHYAALADIVPSITNPIKYHKANVDGTIRILECARKADIKKFVYAASSSCYGIPDQYPTPETTAINPEYPYALTKYLAEEYVMNWGKIYNLPVVSMRFFNVYGLRHRTSGTYGAVLVYFWHNCLQKSHLLLLVMGNRHATLPL